MFQLNFTPRFMYDIHCAKRNTIICFASSKLLAFIKSIVKRNPFYGYVIALYFLL